MLKSIGTVVTAAAVAALVVFATSAVPDAGPSDKNFSSQVVAAGGRHAILPRGTACSAHGWPHFEQSCQFDRRNPANEARNARVIILR